MSQFRWCSSMLWQSLVSRVLIKLFAYPLVRERQSVVVTGSVSMEVHSSEKCLETKCVTLSVSIAFGVPYDMTQSTNTTVATSWAATLGIGTAFVSLLYRLVITTTS